MTKQERTRQRDTSTHTAMIELLCFRKTIIHCRDKIFWLGDCDWRSRKFHVRHLNDSLYGEQRGLCCHKCIVFVTMTTWPKVLGTCYTLTSLLSLKKYSCIASISYWFEHNHNSFTFILTSIGFLCKIFIRSIIALLYALQILSINQTLNSQLYRFYWGFKPTAQLFWDFCNQWIVL